MVSYLVDFYGDFLGGFKDGTIRFGIRLGDYSTIFYTNGLGIRVTMRIFGTLSVGRDRRVTMGTLVAYSGTTASTYGKDLSQGAHDRGEGD